MRLHLSFILLFALIPLCEANSQKSKGPKTRNPSFRCSDERGTTYEVWLTPKDKSLVAKIGKKEVRTILTEPNFGRVAEKAGYPQVYTRINPKGKVEYTRLDLSNQVRVHFVSNPKLQSSSSVVIISNHAEVPGLSCSTNKNASPVVPVATQTTLIQRIAEPILYWGGIRERDGRLTPLSIMNVEASIRRLSLSGLHAKPDSMKKYLEKVSPTIKRILPNSLKIIERRLPKSMRPVLKKVLKEIQYDYYPDVERYLDWIKDGAEKTDQNGKSIPDYNSIYAGLNQFVLSPTFQTPDVRDYVRKQLGETLKRVSPSLIFEVGLDKTPLQKSYLLQLLPDKALIRKVEDFRYTHETAIKMKAALLRSPKKGNVRYNFNEFAPIYRDFLTSSAFRDEELRAFLVRKMAPAFKALKKREEEYLRTYFRPDEAGLLDEMKAYK